MAASEPDTTEHASALRVRLGLEPMTGPNQSSETAREAVENTRVGCAYLERLVELTPMPPKKLARPQVRNHLLDVYEWGNFVLAAYGRFEDLLSESLYGRSGPNLWIPLNNILHQLYAGLGVTDAFAVRPSRFVACARAWSASERDEAIQALERAKTALRDVVLAEMRLWLPTRPPSKPPLSPTARAIANTVRKHGPLQASEIVERLPVGHETTESNVYQIFSKVLIPHYGFTNPGGRRGYHAPAERTWD